MNENILIGLILGYIKYMIVSNTLKNNALTLKTASL